MQIPSQEIDRRNRRCPFFKKQCKKLWDDCALAWETEREFENGMKAKIKGCSMFASVEEMISINGHLSGVKKETGEIKNNALYQALASLGNKQGVVELVKAASRNLKIEHKA